MPVDKPNALSRNVLGDAATRGARRTPDKPAFVLPSIDRTVTFAEFNERTNQAAHAFRDAGLEKGDRIGFVTDNSERMLAAEYGAHKAGLVTSLNNTMVDVDTMTHKLSVADVDALIVDNTLESKVEPFLENHDVELLVSIAWDEDQPATGRRFEEFIADQPGTEPGFEVEGSDPALIIFTSGTTARPKGALHTHASYATSVANVATKHRVRTTDVLAHVHPLFHIVEIHPRCTFALGGTTVLFRGFDPEALMDAVETYDVTVLHLVSTLYRELINETALGDRDLSSVKRCDYGMPMEMTLREKVMDTFDAEMITTYGQTESGIQLFLDTEWQREKGGNPLGVAGPFTDAAIMDEDGNLLPQGEIGEIVVRSPGVMGEYVGKPEKTRELWSDGWHRTGDMGKVDTDGVFQFVDRKRDLIKTGGENVSTAKVLSAVSDHPAVGDAAVVGLPHERWGEAVTAFVVPVEGADATPEEVKEFAGERLAAFETPKAVEFVDSLPKTATDKIRSVELVEEYRDYYR